MSDTILLFALIIILAGVFIQIAHMTRTHNKPWSEYGSQHTFTAEGGIYTDLESGRVFDMREVKHE
jgi:hypothetical protein